LKRKILFIISLSFLIAVALNSFHPNHDVLAQSTPIPYWIKHVAQYWSRGYITDSGYLASLEWLADNHILMIPYTGQSSNNTSADKNIIGTTILSNLFPIRSDIGTQWVIKPHVIVTANQTGFVKGASQEFNFTSNLKEDIITRIMSFDLPGNALNFYQQRISTMEAAGGYTVIPINLDAKCYGTHQKTLTPEIDTVTCVKYNLVIVSKVSGTTPTLQDDAINFEKIMLDKI